MTVHAGPASTLLQVDVVVLHQHVVALLHVRRFALGDRGVAAIVQLHHDLPSIPPTAAARTDRVAGETARHCAANGSGRAAAAMTDLIAERAADDRADHRAERGIVAIALQIDLLHVLHIAAVVIATRRRRWRWRWRWRGRGRGRRRLI